MEISKIFCISRMAILRHMYCDRVELYIYKQIRLFMLLNSESNKLKLGYDYSNLHSTGDGWYPFLK